MYRVVANSTPASKARPQDNLTPRRFARSCLRMTVVVGVLFLGLIALSGCQPPNAGGPGSGNQQKSPFLLHTVQFSGETLSIIAGWYTNSARNWEQIRDANPGLNPHRIKIGDVIQIPRSLVVREDALPKSALSGGGKRAADTGQNSGSSEKPRPAATPSDSAAPVSEHDIAPTPDTDSGSLNTADEQRDLLDELAPKEPEASSKGAETSAESQPAADQSGNSGADTGAAASSAAPEPQPTAKPADAGMKIKSRDELLKELLEE